MPISHMLWIVFGLVVYGLAALGVYEFGGNVKPKWPLSEMPDAFAVGRALVAVIWPVTMTLAYVLRGLEALFGGGEEE